MIKISKKVGIALTVTGLILFGTLAYGVSQIKVKTAKVVFNSFGAPLQEFSSVLLNEKLADEFIQFEYQFLVAEYYAHNKDYATAHIYFEKAVKGAKASLGEKSVFTHFAYVGEAVAEEANGQYLESNEHFKAALKTLPDIEDYDVNRWVTQSWLISTMYDNTNPQNIPLYREHLALTEKLQGIRTERRHLVRALSLLASALDQDAKTDEAERVWRRMIQEAHGKDYPKRLLVGDLLDFVFHESNAGNKSEADKALAEATLVAEQINDDQIRASVLQLKGDLCMDCGELDGANDIYQQLLKVAQKTKNKPWILAAYDSLAELEEHRGNLLQREKYVEKAFEVEEQALGKYTRLTTLALLARANGEVELARSYVKRWKSMQKKSFEPTKFISKKELDAFLILYPKLPIGKLEPTKSNRFPHMLGYDIRSQQLDILMNAI